MKKVIQELDNTLACLKNAPCNFWACKGTPENNRIEHMITCGNCQAIIHANRAKKQLTKLV